MHRLASSDHSQIDTDLTTGYPGNTTREQDIKVEELQKELQGEGFFERLDVPSMLRFLRARKFDVAQAKAMFIECEKWRKDFGVDDIVKNFHYHEKMGVFKYYPQYYHKEDKVHILIFIPVYIEQLGKINLHEMYKITTEERMLQNLVYEYEKFINYRLFVLNLVLGKFYMINAPWGFSSAFRVIKLLLDPATVSKIYILGTDYKSVLLEQIPEKNLPKILGGSCECDGGCEFSDAGAWNDSRWIELQNENNIQANNDVNEIV
ncbi:hypothetical protein PCK1_000015 [Pneumocystis canis]|nr:hypothetical protein PCK1_000015 [Pneumocystis canis]